MTPVSRCACAGADTGVPRLSSGGFTGRILRVVQSHKRVGTRNAEEHQAARCGSPHGLSGHQQPPSHATFIPAALVLSVPYALRLCCVHPRKQWLGGGFPVLQGSRQAEEDCLELHSRQVSVGLLLSRPDHAVSRFLTLWFISLDFKRSLRAVTYQIGLL